MTEAKSKVGVEHLKTLCIFLALSVTCEQKAMADGAITLADTVFTVDPIMALPSTLAGISYVPGEVLDLDPSEAEELSAAIKEKLDLVDDAAEQVVKQVIGVALGLAATVLTVRNARAAA